jgi:nucleotide-binding universal stress UspA family protein
MRLVLVGDDGSPAAARAVAWATRFAGERDAQLTVVHVTTTGEDVPVDDDAVDHVVVNDSHPASAIMNAAAEVEADVIVLGRRGRGGFPSLPIGTTVHSVAGACGRPVVVVPLVDLAPDAPLLRHVVVGLDGHAGSASAAAWAVRHCGAARFTAVHALEHVPALVDGGSESTADLHERATALLRDSWSRPLRDAGVDLDLVVDDGDAADVILATAEDVRADLVVVGRQDRGTTCGILGGVSQRVLAYAPGAAAIVQPSPQPSGGQP